MAKQQHEEKENKERWLLTYADLITLLMIFFVVMYSISQVNAQKFKQLAQSLSIVFGGGGHSLVGESPGRSFIPLPTPAQSSDLQEVRASAEDLLAHQGARHQSSANVEDQSLRITLANRLIFGPASASITVRAQKHLVALGKLLSDTEGSIRVEGYTDNTPVHSAEFASNWQLSAMRAANIAQLLAEQAGIKPSRISAIGYGATHPVGDNRTPEGRARNRRVVIVLRH